MAFWLRWVDWVLSSMCVGGMESSVSLERNDWERVCMFSHPHLPPENKYANALKWIMQPFIISCYICAYSQYFHTHLLFVYILKHTILVSCSTLENRSQVELCVETTDQPNYVSLSILVIDLKKRRITSVPFVCIEFLVLHELFGIWNY